MNTKKCNTCNKEKPLTEFYKQKDRKNGSTKCKTCFNDYCIARWKQRKKDAISYKGGKCEKCGIEDHYSIYAFHHIDSSTKTASWNKIRLWSWSKVKTELDLCELLCHNCHAKVHWKDNI